MIQIMSFGIHVDADRPAGVDRWSYVQRPLIDNSSLGTLLSRVHLCAEKPAKGKALTFAEE